jgi:hypothetical protein
MSDPAAAVENGKVAECQQGASSSPVQPANERKKKNANDDGSSAGNRTNDSVHGSSNKNNKTKNGKNDNHPQGAVGIGTSGTGDSSSSSGNINNGNLQQKMPGATNAAKAMGAASLAPPLLVMQPQTKLLQQRAAAGAATVPGRGPDGNNPQNLLYPNSLLNNSNNKITFAEAQAQAAAMMNLQLPPGSQQQHQQQQQAAAWQQYHIQQQRSFGMNPSAFNQLQQQKFQQQFLQQQLTNRGVMTIQNGGSSNVAGYYGGGGGGPQQLATNHLAFVPNTTGFPVAAGGGFAPIGGATLGGATKKKPPKPNPSQKRNWDKVITNTALCLPAYASTEKPPAEGAKPPPPPSLTAATTTDASKLELSYVLSLKSNDPTKLFSRLNFQNCDIATIDAIFPFKYDTKSKAPIGPHPPPREWRNNAKRIREWRRFGKKSQEAIMAKIDGGHSSFVDVDDNERDTNLYSPRGGGSHRRRLTSIQRPMVGKHVLRPRRKFSIIEPILLKRKAPSSLPSGRAAITKKPKSGAIHLLNGKDRARNLNHGVPSDDFIFRPTATRREPDAADSPYTSTPVATIPAQKQPESTYKYVKCQGMTLDHLRARARLEGMRADTIKGFGHCIGEALHNYATTISNQETWPLDPRLYQGAIFSSKSHEVSL